MVSRPFRLAPPYPPGGSVARPRLIERLQHRWDRRLVTVVAGAGFGKTVLLSAVVGAKGALSAGRDVWLCCEPADEYSEHLIEGLLAAVGLAPGAGLDAVLEWVWTQAPTPVCFVFDDVHEVPANSPGAAVLSRLVTDLPRNGHVVMSSRDRVPVSAARLAAAAQLERITEAELVLEPSELRAFGASRGIDPAVLESTGGWPALAELTASAGSDLLFDYLWEEILGRVGLDRAQLLARFARIGGGDDEIATALAGRALCVDDLLEGVPLVERSASGWAALHPLWGPHLRRLLSDAEASAALRSAAEVHRVRGRFTVAADLLIEAEAWEGVQAILREVAVAFVTPPVVAAELGRWCRALPPRWRDAPAALLAMGLEREASSPLDAIPFYESAALGFRRSGDVDGELAAIARDGLVRWWVKDLAGLFVLLQRAEVLARLGSASAKVLTAIGEASLAHLGGDSAKTLAALALVDEARGGAWIPYVHWHRSVAHRRNGDLRKARAELKAAHELPIGQFAYVLQSAGLHIDWLEGDADPVCRGLAELRALHERVSSDDFLGRESVLELACKVAWLGDLETAKRCLLSADELVTDMPGLLAPILRLIAAAAIAVGEGDEGRAIDVLEEAINGALAGSNRWYWRDRAAVALPYVLLAQTRSVWAQEPLSPAHRPGLMLAQALVASRAGDESVVRALQWPDPGVVRTHLPSCWIAELASVGIAWGNPPPRLLMEEVGSSLRTALHRLGRGSPSKPTTAARALLASIPVQPPHRLHVDLIGPLELRLGETAVRHADLRRQRVRQLLCYLVVKERVRREEATADLWPDLDDGGRNLRVTLNYLQHLFEPDRGPRQPAFFVRVEGPWLVLRRDELLVVDAWEMIARLGEAEAAESAGIPSAALAAYRVVLPLWRGEPFADAPYASWAESARIRLRTRYAAGMVRAGELELAGGDPHEAQRFAEAAVATEPYAEAAHRLLARSHIEQGDRGSALRALENCRSAFRELDVDMEPATAALLATLAT